MNRVDRSLSGFFIFDDSNILNMKGESARDLHGAATDRNSPPWQALLVEPRSSLSFQSLLNMTSPDPSSPSSSSSHNPFPTDSPAFDAAQQTYQPDSAFFQALMQKTSHYDLNKDEQKAVDRAWMTFRGGGGFN